MTCRRPKTTGRWVWPDPAGRREQRRARAKDAEAGRARRRQPFREGQGGGPRPFRDRRACRGALISLQTWVLAIGLILVGLSAWYFLQAPSADDSLRAHHVRHGATARSPPTARPRATSDRFIDLYSDDSRSSQLQKYLNEIELDRSGEQSSTRRARGSWTPDGCCRSSGTTSKRSSTSAWTRNGAWRSCEALIDLYEAGGDDSGPTGQCLDVGQETAWTGFASRSTRLPPTGWIWCSIGSTGPTDWRPPTRTRPGGCARP